MPNPSAAAHDARIDLWLATPAAAARFSPQTQRPQESARWQRIRGEARRRDWAVSRALIAHVAPRPPALPSLSHSAAYAVLAVPCPALTVGVDLEHMRSRDFLRLARFAFAPAEHAALAALPPGRRGERFYLLWTLKEAFAKALGLPLLASLRECEFSERHGAWRARVPTSGAWSAQVLRPLPCLTLSAVALLDARRAALPPRVVAHEWPAPARQAWTSVLTLHSK